MEVPFRRGYERETIRVRELRRFDHELVFAASWRLVVAPEEHAEADLLARATADRIRHSYPGFVAIHVEHHLEPTAQRPV